MNVKPLRAFMTVPGRFFVIGLFASSVACTRAPAKPELDTSTQLACEAAWSLAEQAVHGQMTDAEILQSAKKVHEYGRASDVPAIQQGSEAMLRQAGVGTGVVRALNTLLRSCNEAKAALK